MTDTTRPTVEALIAELNNQPDGSNARERLSLFRKSARVLGALLTERDAADGTIQQLRVMNIALERSDSAARAQIALAKEIHVPMAYWSGEDPSVMVDEDGNETEPAGYVCLTCSAPHVEYDLQNWELDTSDADVVEYPCETVRALS